MPENRVKLTDQERLDAPDARALQELVYTYLREALGGILGNVSGLLTPLAWSEINDGITYTLNLDPFVLAHVETQDTRVEDRGAAGAVNVGCAWGSMVHTFDPATLNINHPLDYTLARNAELAAPGTQPYLWARPSQLPADTDTRRFWDVATGVETPVGTTKTRTETVLEFQIGDTQPLAAGGLPYVAFAQVVSWAAGTVPSVIYSLSAWDDANTQALLQDAGTSGDPGTDLGGFAHPINRLAQGSDLYDGGTVASWPPGTERTAGLAYHLQWIRSRIQRLLSGGTADPVGTEVKAWWEIPQVSLEGAKVTLDDHEARLVVEESVSAALLQHVNVDKWAQVTLASGVLQFTPDVGTIDQARWDWISGYGFLQAVTQITAPWQIQVGVHRANWPVITDDDVYITGVQVTPLIMGGVTAAWQQPMVLLPQMQNVGTLNYGDAVLPAVQRLSDYPPIGATARGVTLHLQQDNDGDGVLGNVAHGVDGLVWGSAQKLAWTVTVIGSKLTRGNGGGSF